MRKLLLIMSFVIAFCTGLNAQKTSLTGTVTGDDGLPIPGASVIVKGTTIGTVTNLDGQYTLQVPADATTLVFTFIGMAQQEQPIDGRKVIDVRLSSDEQLVDEVVVTAYGTSTKGTFTGSAAAVSSEQLQKRQVSNVTQALAGQVAGVQIQSSNGQPGVSATVRIRGVGSINSGTTPLYVVDGIPYDGSISSINTNDIESMTVLKDAASTSLYGARGANGIIMITTKKGSRKNEGKINFDAKVGVNSRSVTNYDVLTDPQTYMETAYQAIYNAGIYNLKMSPSAANARANSVLPTGTDGGLGYTIYTVPEGQLLIGTNGKLNPNATLGYSDGKYYYTPDDWDEETFVNNNRQEYNLSFSDANDKGSYYLSFGYLNDEGIIDGSGFERYTGRIKTDYKIKSYLKVGANVGYTYSKSFYPSEQTETSSSGNAFFVANMIAPVYPIFVRNADGSYATNKGRRVYDYGDGKSTNFSRSFMSISNPKGDLIYDKRVYLRDALAASTFAELTPLKGLTLTARFGLNLENLRFNKLSNVYYGQSAEYGGEAIQEHMRDCGFDRQYIADYSLTLNEDHDINITVGYDGYDYSTTDLWAQGQNLYNPDSYYVNNAIDQKQGGGSKEEYSTMGYFGRINYAYQGKYIVNGAVRRDASSRFHPDNRWGTFWAGSAAWLASSEEFMKGISWINMLKVKASIGQQGNDDILDMDGYSNYYPYLDQYSMTGADGVFSDGTLIYKGNPDLTWETSTSFNAGVEFALLGNRINGSAEYFIRKSTDMLYNQPVAGSLGYTSIPMNVGSMSNSGVELDLSCNILKIGDLRWDINANATFIKNKINELHPDLNGKLIDGSYIYEEGESRYRMYLTRYAGVDPETGLAMYWAKDDEGNDVKTSDYRTASNYKQATDDLLPKVYGGFGTSLTAYGFDASIQFSYQLGGKIFDSGYQRLMHGGTSSSAGTNWHKDIKGAWTEANPNTDVPRLDANDSYASSTSDRWLTKSDYLSLNNITVGYTLPSSILEKIYIDKVRIYFAADNVALISARKGLDPRQSYTSATTARYTPIRTVSGGVSITF